MSTIPSTSPLELSAVLAATAPQNDEHDQRAISADAMSDVDVVQSSSLPTPSVEVSRATQPEENRHNSSQKPSSADPVAVADSDESRNGRADDGPFSPRADSEAETIIQSGRESLSPEKRRKLSGFERNHDHALHGISEPAAAGDVSPTSRKRKRDDEDPSLVDGGQHSTNAKSRDELLPPTRIKKEPVEEPPNVIARSDSSEVPSGTESPRSRKRSSSDSALDGDATDAVSRARADLAADREHRSTSRSGSSKSKERSTSPSCRSHKRTVSGPSTIQKKKSAGTLLSGRQRHGSEDRQSVSSSASGSPMPPSQRRRLTSEGAAASPARPVSHKKQRDQNGRTRLARACAAQEYEAAVARHAERPEDLNVADNAGNTPLQIAALEGCVPIVKFLLDAGCEVDTRNIDKDTPLIDAVENGHLEVVKLLLEAGANPRLVNAQGDEPYDLVPSDSEDYEEIRRVLAEAKANPRNRRTDAQNARENSSKPSVQPAPSVQSPRESPFRSPPPARRKTTVRREVTRNDLFWTQATPENLREFAAKGDMAGVANILNITQKADPESLIAAAKGGHEDVMSLLLGIGFADPDPDPIDSPHLRPGYNTPMLAAIGRGNLGVIRLLLDQPNFDPTRRVYQDRYYFEIARDRKGENWEEEEELLRSAFEKYQAAKKEQQLESKSPRRSRDESKDGRRSSRQESPSRSVSSRRSGHDGELRTKSAKARDTSSRRRERSLVTGGRPKAVRRDDSSDRRSSQTSTHNSEEAPVRRRRLIAGRPPQNRDQPRPSFAFSESSEDEKVSVNRPRDSILKRSRSSESVSDGRTGPGESQKRRRVLSDESDHDAPNANSDVKESRPASSTSASLDSPHVKSETRDHDSEVPVDVGDGADAEAKAEEERIAAEKEQAEHARLKKEEDLRQAAELVRAAREKAEEEERRRREAELRRARQVEEERQRRAEQERMRIAKLRRDQEEQEQRRRDALPDRLRIAANLIGANDPRARSHAWLRHFMPVVTAQTKQLDPQCSPEAAEERWVPNFLVAPLLATNDLQLSQYASWEKRQATPTQRLNLWRVTRRILQVDESEAPGTFGQVIRKDEETRPKYFDMEHVFWVKVRL